VNIQRLDHLVLAVQDLDAGIERWADVFGLPADPVVRPEGTHMALAFLRPGGDPSLHSGQAAAAAFLELVQPTTDDHRIARHIAERGEGMFSISVQVDDLDAAVRHLRARGLEVSDPEPGVLPATRVARIPRATARGVALQLIERRPA